MKPGTPVYPYSIIPGGVDSPGDLAAHMASDPVVAEHFSAFDFSSARVMRTERPRVMYASYRVRDNVYWTRKPLMIPKGEAVLTDGIQVARVRCGNRLSETPGPVSAEEPAPELMEEPIPFPEGSPEFDILPVPPMPYAVTPPPPSAELRSVLTPPEFPEPPKETPSPYCVPTPENPECKPCDPTKPPSPDNPCPKPQPTPSVPEPSVVWLLGTAAALAGFRRIRALKVRG